MDEKNLKTDINTYKKILKKYGVELDPAEFLEWVKGFEQLANLTIAYERRRAKSKGQDPPQE